MHTSYFFQLCFCLFDFHDTQCQHRQYVYYYEAPADCTITFCDQTCQTECGNSDTNCYEYNSDCRTHPGRNPPFCHHLSPSTAEQEASSICLGCHSRHRPKAEAGIAEEVRFSHGNPQCDFAGIGTISSPGCGRFGLSPFPCRNTGG